MLLGCCSEAHTAKSKTMEPLHGNEPGFCNATESPRLGLDVKIHHKAKHLGFRPQSWDLPNSPPPFPTSLGDGAARAFKPHSAHQHWQKISRLSRWDPSMSESWGTSIFKEHYLLLTKDFLLLGFVLFSYKLKSKKISIVKSLRSVLEPGWATNIKEARPERRISFNKPAGKERWDSNCRA